MSYQVTTYEATAERRDDPNSVVNKRRTVATHPVRSNAIETARALLETHAEVTIWNGKPGAGEIVEKWVPAKTIILSEPRWVGTAESVKAWDTSDINQSRQSLEPHRIAPEKPLSPNTMMRISNGVEKFCGSPLPTLVDRHFYEYTGGDGTRVYFAFEVDPGEEPEVPKFGTRPAIEQYQRQWQWRDHQEKKHARASSVSDELHRQAEQEVKGLRALGWRQADFARGLRAFLEEEGTN